MRFLEVMFKNIVEQKQLLCSALEPLAPVRHRWDESTLFYSFFGVMKSSLNTFNSEVCFANEP